MEAQLRLIPHLRERYKLIRIFQSWGSRAISLRFRTWSYFISPPTGVLPAGSLRLCSRTSTTRLTTWRSCLFPQTDPTRTCCLTWRSLTGTGWPLSTAPPWPMIWSRSSASRASPPWLWSSLTGHWSQRTDGPMCAASSRNRPWRAGKTDSLHHAHLYRKLSSLKQIIVKHVCIICKYIVDLILQRKH